MRWRQRNGRGRSSVYYSIRPKSFPGNEHTGVWYMGSSPPCNGNLSVLYDFIQNSSPLCGATKHIKAKWWMIAVSARKQVEDAICVLHPHLWGMREFILIIVKRICPTVRVHGMNPAIVACMCMWVWWLKCPSVALNKADFYSSLNEMPGP